MSTHSKQTHSTQTQDPKNDVNRRRFVQSLMAAVPAVSLGCAIPALGSASGTGEGNASRRGTWVCVIDVLFTLGDMTVYLVSNCDTGEFNTFVGTAGMPIGDCREPENGGCTEIATWNRYPRTDDEFSWVLSPQLNEQQLQKLDYIRSAMMSSRL